MGGDVMPGADLTPARLEQLLAAATPGPWFVVEDDRPGMEWNRHICWDEHGDHRIAFMASDAGTEANAALIALSPALAARVIELEGEVERLRGALRAIASHGNNCGCHQATFINIARTALTQKQAQGGERNA